MKRSLLVAAAAAIVLVAANLPANEPTTSKKVTLDWHYRWHEGRWWYWMPENSKWMVWTDSTWVPFEQFSSCPNMYPVSQAKSSNGNFENRTESGYSGGSNYRQSTYSGYSDGSGNNYSGYGWGWGPGTAFRDSPGRRF